MKALCLDDQRDIALGYPAYLLVHENVVSPYIRALSSLLPADVKYDVQPLVESRTKVEGFLASLGSRLPLGSIPVYTIRSIDAAIDFVQTLAERPRQIYVQASPRFGAYVVNSVKEADVVYVDQFPRAAIGLGPYIHRQRFSFTQQRSIGCGHHTEDEGARLLPGSYQRLNIWRLKQDLGKRIDFFGGSESSRPDQTMLRNTDCEVSFSRVV
jgi:hypothetical protein